MKRNVLVLNDPGTSYLDFDETSCDCGEFPCNNCRRKNSREDFAEGSLIPPTINWEEAASFPQETQRGPAEAARPHVVANEDEGSLIPPTIDWESLSRFGK